MAYIDLKDPFDEISWIRPIIAVLYLIIAARFFMVVTDRRKPVVFGLALLAAPLATGANFFALKSYFNWHQQNSSCEKTLAQRGIERTAESALKDFASKMNGNNNNEGEDNWVVSYRAEGRTLFHIYRPAGPGVILPGFRDGVAQIEKDALKRYCSEGGEFFRILKATETQIFYSFEGERITSFSVGPADCPKW